MRYIIKGEFNSGLTVSKDGNVLFYSNCVRKGFNKCEIEIFNSTGNLILKVVSGESLAKLVFNNKISVSFEGRKGISYKGNIIISDVSKEIIEVSYSFFSLLKSHARFYLRGKIIGSVNKKFFKLRSEFTVNLSDEFDKVHDYILIYLLIYETNFDHV